MNINISHTVLAVVLAAGTSAAHAQTVITRQITDRPVETIITQEPVQTVQTTETVQTVRPATGSLLRRRVVTTRRTVVSRRVVPDAVVAAPLAANPRPLYDVVAPGPVVTAPGPLYDAAPLYDTAPLATVDETVVAPPPAVGTALPAYRYVYEPDRILVIDPVTNIAVQAIPR